MYKNCVYNLTVHWTRGVYKTSEPKVKALVGVISQRKKKLFVFWKEYGHVVKLSQWDRTAVSGIKI